MPLWRNHFQTQLTIHTQFLSFNDYSVLFSWLHKNILKLSHQYNRQLKEDVWTWMDYHTDCRKYACCHAQLFKTKAVGCSFKDLSLQPFAWQLKWARPSQGEHILALPLQYATHGQGFSQTFVDSDVKLTAVTALLCLSYAWFGCEVDCSNSTVMPWLHLILKLWLSALADGANGAVPLPQHAQTHSLSTRGWVLCPRSQMAETSSWEISIKD